MSASGNTFDQIENYSLLKRQPDVHELKFDYLLNLAHNNIMKVDKVMQ